LEEARKYYVAAQTIVEKELGTEHPKALQLKSLMFICDNYNSL